jgi:cell division protein FtsL
MEQILAFVLGVGAVTFVWVVVAAFKTASKVKEIERAISEQQDWISRNDESVNRRIDQEITRVDTIYDNCIKYTDSRVDRLEHKYIEQTQSKKLING